MMAGAVVLSIPAILLFLITQRYFLSNDLGSGVKG
jgi:multiple sugar transport system permease protein